MSYKVYKSQNYFVVHDTATNEDVIRQVRNLVRWEKKGTLYSFYYNTPNLTTSGNAIVRLGSVYEFSDLVDSTGSAWASQLSLDLYLEQWTGHICCPVTGEDALYNLYNSVPTLLSTGAIPSGATSDITAPDGTINIKKTGDGTISSQSVPSGATIDYSVADNAITVNSANGFTIDATDSLDIVLKDTTGATVTPTSVTPHAGTHHVDIVLPANVPTYSSARLMKTGQTTSYATNDDGDLERGRGSSFFTLISNSPFGNTNRFTSDNFSAQTTYTNNIVIDWSTYDGTTVLGYRRTELNVTSGGWANCVSTCAALSFGGYTSGWRLANLNEWNNILNIEYSNPLGYVPFNTFAWTYGSHSSSSYKAAPTVYSWGINSIGYNLAKDKTESSSCLAVRTFTVTGTTLS